MANFGFVKSKLNGTEQIFNITQNEGGVLPEKYSYKNFLPKVINQGDKPICVPCSLSAYLNWKENLKDGSKKDNGIDYMEIFGARQSFGSDGMSFKDALHYLKHDGVVSDVGLMKINSYSMIMNYYSLMCAIVMNGPCVGGLPVYNYENSFWDKGYNDSLLGYHAVSIVGYENGKFILRNSWGRSFGDNGYCSIDFSEINKFVEVWTIVN